MAETRLFHFSEDDSIETFEPRPVEVPSDRAAGQEWLNGPLVWAVEENFQATYLFREIALVSLFGRLLQLRQRISRSGGVTDLAHSLPTWSGSG